jgi:hypothetical protein
VADVTELDALAGLLEQAKRELGVIVMMTAP